MKRCALPPESREMKAFLAYMRGLSAGIPDGAKLVGAGTLRIKEPGRAADLDSARKPWPAISFRQSRGERRARIVSVFDAADFPSACSAEPRVTLR